MNIFPFIGPGGLKEQHRRKAIAEGAGRIAHAKALTQERKRHDNLIVGALDSWDASPQAVYRAVMTYDNR